MINPISQAEKNAVFVKGGAIISAAEKISAVEKPPLELEGRWDPRAGNSEPVAAKVQEWKDKLRLQKRASAQQKQAIAARRAELKEAALQVRRATETLGQKYLKLCGVIRDLQATPAEVQEVLSGVGFSPSRISEIKRVSFCSPELFATFQKKLIGFKPALQKAIEEGGGKEKRGRKAQDWWEAIWTFAVKRSPMVMGAPHRLSVLGGTANLLIMVRGFGPSADDSYQFTQDGYRVVVEKLPETKTKKGAPRTPRKKAGRK